MSEPPFDPLQGPRAELAKVIPRRPRVKWWIGLLLAGAFAVLMIPTITVEQWFGALGAGHVTAGKRAAITVRVPPLAGANTAVGRLAGGGVLIARGEVATLEQETAARALDQTRPYGAPSYLAYFALVVVLAGIFTHHTRRSTYGRLVRVQLVNLALIAVAAVAVKAVLLTTSVSVLVVPVALFAMLPTLALDRIVGLATGTLAALVMSLLVPFDVGIAIVLLVPTATTGLVIAERPKRGWRTVLLAGAVATVFTGATYALLHYLTTGELPKADVGGQWLAAALGPAIAMMIAMPLVPFYQLLVGEITFGKLIHLEDLSHPLLKQISERSPGTWQHSLMMANMAEIAANAIGANGRLVRVGAYFHDLGKSLQPKYFIENLEPGETSPHDQLPPEVSCDAIFAHVTEGIVTARRAGLHERIVDFMHMHHGNGVLEYFWAKCREQGNPNKLSVEHFRYPGVPPQSRETAILAICDAVEAASRTLKKPDTASIDSLVQRIVYGKLHLGQLDESGMSMADLRRMAESLRDTIRHANHGRIEYPWQKAQQDASASGVNLTQTGPRLDSLDRPAHPDAVRSAAPAPESTSDQALALTADQRGDTPNLKKPANDDHVDLDAATRRVEKTEPEDAQSEADEGPTLRPRSVPREAPDAAPPGAVPATPEAVAFAAAATEALDEASKDIQILPRETAEVDSAARKKAATIPPVAMRKPPSVPPGPLKAMMNFTVPPPATLRPPAAPSGPVIDPVIAKGASSSAKRPAALIVEDAEDGSIKIEPSGGEAGSTNPRFSFPIGDSTEPRFEPQLPPRDREPKTSWARGLASRLDSQADEEFGAETPVVAPTRAELQASLNAPLDPTRQIDIAQLEALHAESLERNSEPELDFTRRRPYPTAEVNEDDIESAIELAPPARRNALAVAKQPTNPKKPKNHDT